MDLRLSVWSDLGYDRGYGQKVSYDGSGSGAGELLCLWKSSQRLKHKDKSVCVCVCLCQTKEEIKKESLYSFFIFGFKTQIIEAKLTGEYDLCRQIWNAPGSRLPWLLLLATDNRPKKKKKELPFMQVRKQPGIPTASLNSLAEILQYRPTVGGLKL